MGSLISMLATIVLISTVSTLIFAVFAYIASRRPQRQKKVAAAPVESVVSPAAPVQTTVPLQTISMDGTARSVPIILVQDMDRAGQLAEEWATRQTMPPTSDTEPLFKTFKIEEDAYSSLN